MSDDKFYNIGCLNTYISIIFGSLLFLNQCFHFPLIILHTIIIVYLIIALSYISLFFIKLTVECLNKHL